jgi:hypothetical protein
MAREGFGLSCRVLVIPEDPTHDQYILKPVVEAMFRSLGKPNARVEVLKDPHWGRSRRPSSATTSQPLSRTTVWSTSFY